MAIGNFTLALNTGSINSLQQLNLAVRAIGFEVTRRVLYRTPVAKGRLLANWGVQFGAPYTGYDHDARTSDKAAMFAKLQRQIKSWNIRQPMFLCNNTAYSLKIEYGGSPVKSPEGMVRVTIAEMGGVAESIAGAA